MQQIQISYYGSRSLIGEIMQNSGEHLNKEPYELTIDSMVISLADLAVDLAKVELMFGKRCMKLTVLGFDAVEGKWPRYAHLTEEQMTVRMDEAQHRFRGNLGGF